MARHAHGAPASRVGGGRRGEWDRRRTAFRRFSRPSLNPRLSLSSIAMRASRAALGALRVMQAARASNGRAGGARRRLGPRWPALDAVDAGARCASEWGRWRGSNGAPRRVGVAADPLTPVNSSRPPRHLYPGPGPAAGDQARARGAAAHDQARVAAPGDQAFPAAAAPEGDEAGSHARGDAKAGDAARGDAEADAEADDDAARWCGEGRPRLPRRGGAATRCRPASLLPPHTATPSPTPSSNGGSGSSPPPSPPPPSGGDLAGTPASTATGLSGGAIAGITIGAVAAVAAIAGGVTYAMRRREEGVEGVVKV